MYIVTLSSIPPRFADLPAVLASLLAQARRPAEIRLYIPRRYPRFPDWDGSLPALPPGIDLRRVEADLGPGTKVLYAAQELAGQAVDLLYCDDDRLYSPAWAERFLAARAAHPGAAICLQGFHMRHIGLPEVLSPAPRMRRGRGKRDPLYRLHRAWQRLRWGEAVPPFAKAKPHSFARSGYVDIAEGLSGVLIRPDFLPADAAEIPAAFRGVDDIWLSGQMARQGVPVWLQAGRARLLRDLPSQHGADALYRQGSGEADRLAANRACAEWLQARYGIWRPEAGVTTAATAG